MFEKSKNLNFAWVYNGYMGLFIAVFCAFPKLIPLFIGGLIVITIVGYKKNKLVFHLSKPLLFLAFLYVVYLVGTLFTHHQDLANRYIENKLSFLIFPALFSFRSREKMYFSPVVSGLIVGVTLASFMGLAHSYDVFLNSPLYKDDINNSFGTINFSYIHHPSYFSAFLTIALAGSWVGYIEKWKNYSFWWIIPFSIFTLMMQLFCFALAGMLILFLLGLAVYVYLAYKRLNKFFFLLAIIFIPVIPVALYNSNIHIQIEVDTSFAVLKEFIKEPINFIKNKKEPISGSEARIIMGIVSYQSFKENLLGVGTGNVDEILTKKLIGYGKNDLAKREYNPHNQFLQTGLEIGLIGLFFLVAFLVSAIQLALKHKNVLLAIVVFTLVFNSLFESILQRQSGIIFYSFFICLLVSFLAGNSNNKKELLSSEKRS